MSCTKCEDSCKCYNIARDFKVTGTLNSTGKLRLTPPARVTYRIKHLEKMEPSINIVTTEKTDEKQK